MLNSIIGGCACPRLTVLFLWRSRSLSLVGKVLILNILGLSKLLFVSRFVDPPRWVLDRVKSLIWPFLWATRLETVARMTIIWPVPKGGLGLKDFACQGKAAWATFVCSLADASSQCFFTTRYFCGAGIAPLRQEWATLHDNLTPSAAWPTQLYASIIASLRSPSFPQFFIRNQGLLFAFGGRDSYPGYTPRGLDSLPCSALFPSSSLETCL